MTTTTDSVLTIGISGDSSLCQGETIYLVAIGTGPFLWSTGSSADSIAVSGPGMYSVSVSNSCGTFTASQAVNLDSLPIPVITTSGPATFCYGDSLILTASGGQVLNWSTLDTTTSITVYTAGTYTVTVSNSCGTASASQSVSVDTAVFVSLSGDSVVCQGDSVTLTAFGNGDYLWSTGSLVNTITVAAPGTYTVTVTNSCGSAQTSITVTQDSLPVAFITAGGPTTFCTGDSVQLTAGGSGGYLWSTGDTSASIFVSMAGTYTVTVSNSCGTAASSEVITTENPPVAGISGGNSFCQGDSVILNASGGGAYHWSDGSTGNSLVILTPGSYTVTVTNSCGSSSASQTVTMDSLPVAQIQLSGPAIFCDGDSVILTAAGGTGFQWSTGATSSSITVTVQGTYTVTVTNTCGSSTDVQSVSVLNHIVITAGGPTALCKGDSVILTASGGAPYFWVTEETTPSITVDTAGVYWVLGTNGCPPSMDSITVTVDSIPVVVAFGDTILCPGDSVLLSATGGLNYFWSTGDSLPQIYVHVSGTYISYSTNACGTGSDTISVSPSGLLVQFSADDSAGLAPFLVHFLNQSSSAFQPVTYSWDFGDQSTSTDINPQHTFTDTGTYVVVLTGTDQMGCRDTFSLLIQVEGDDCFILPDIFTPNGDNLNEYFNAMGVCIREVEGQIFNRWGVELSEWKGTEKGWDGTTRGGFKVPPGSYFYIMDIQLVNGDRFRRKGIVTLIR